MEEFLQKYADKLNAHLAYSASYHGVAKWGRWTIMIEDRPLICVCCSPVVWPVKVEYYHADPSIVTTHAYEWGVDPNTVGARRIVDDQFNPITIDNYKELAKVIDGLLKLEETKRILEAYEL